MDGCFVWITLVVSRLRLCLYSVIRLDKECQVIEGSQVTIALRTFRMNLEWKSIKATGNETDCHKLEGLDSI